MDNDIYKLLYNEYFWKNILINIFVVLALVVIVVLLLIYFESKKNYDVDKIKSKLTHRTSKKEIGGGQEAFLRYWVWQRKKRLVIIRILVNEYDTNGFYYPKRKWLRAGRVKIPFRRECWVIL